MSKIFVRNLPPSTTADELRELFGAFGRVDRVELVTAIDTGRSRGSAFVEMSSGAEEAIEALDRTLLGGRSLGVSSALPVLRSAASRQRMPKRARNYRAEQAGSAIHPA